jgi:hypothetical protein
MNLVEWCTAHNARVDLCFELRQISCRPFGEGNVYMQRDPGRPLSVEFPFCGLIGL